MTEGLFFNGAPSFIEIPLENTKYYYDRTPAQRVSFELNRVLESQFVFLDKDFLSINGQLEVLQLQSRSEFFMMPTFPRNFKRNQLLWNTFYELSGNSAF